MNMSLGSLLVLGTGAAVAGLTLLVALSLLTWSFSSSPRQHQADLGFERRTLLLQKLAIVAGLVVVAVLLLPVAPAVCPSPLLVHRLAISCLGVFLLVAQYAQLRAVVTTLGGGSSAQVRSCYRWLWCVTEILPAPTALALLASGMRLASDYGRSPQEGWLLLLVLSFGFLFFDGILGFTPLARGLRRAAGRARESDIDSELRGTVLGVRTNATVTVHFSSLPPLVLVGWFKPPFVNPLASGLTSLEGWVASLTGMATLGVQAATLLAMLTSGIGVLILRRLSTESHGD